jgi:hypothetical protein
MQSKCYDLASRQTGELSTQYCTAFFTSMIARRSGASAGHNRLQAATSSIARSTRFVAEAVISARILKLITAREAAEYKLGTIDDFRWEQIAAVWEWHFRLSTLDLRRATDGQNG